MSRDNIRKIEFVLIFVVLAVLVICFEDIKSMWNEAMMGQADSLMDQVLR